MDQISKKYVIPYLEKYEYLNDLINRGERSNSTLFSESEGKKDIVDFQDLVNNKTRAFIIAEPGCGKSELLRQIVSLKNNKESISFAKFISLSKVYNTSTIEDFYDCRYQIYCFDALDEVPFQYLSAILDQLYSFSKKNSGCSIFISCRLHYIINYKNSISNFENFNFIKIFKFNELEIRDFLNNANTDNKELIQDLAQKIVSSNEKEAFLHVPRYLKTISDLLRRKLIDETEISIWKRIDFFERLIYADLEAEVEKGTLKTKNEIEISRRVLEKLALVMEIYQVNSITKEEFISFLDYTNSNINLVFLQACEIDTFLERLLQVRKQDELDYLEFMHTEFQEYLAAKELNRLASTSQVIYDFVIQPDFNQIYSNWYDILRFLLEINPKHLLDLMEFLCIQNEPWAKNTLNNLLPIVDPESLTNHDKKFIFEKVYSYIQKTPSFWLSSYDTHIFKFLFYDSIELVINVPDISSISDEILDNEIRCISNQLKMLSNAKAKELIPEDIRIIWKNFFLKKIKETHDQSLNQLILRNFYIFCSIEDLNDNMDVFLDGDTEIKEAFLETLRVYIKTNNVSNDSSNFLIDIIVKALSDPDLDFINQCIDDIRTPQLLELLINTFLNTPDAIKGYLRNSNRHITINRFEIVDHLGKEWSPELEKPTLELLKLLLDKDFCGSFNEERFVQKLIHLLSKKNPSFLSNVANFDDNKLEYIFVYYRHTLGECLKAHNTEVFVKEIIKKGTNFQYFIFDLFLRLYDPMKETQCEVFRIGKEFIPRLNELEKVSNQGKKSYKIEEEEKSTYEYFQKLLNAFEEDERTEVLGFFLKNKEVIKKYSNEIELDPIREYINNQVQHFNVESLSINSKKYENDKVNYQISKNIVVFFKYLEIAEELSVINDIEISRSQLLYFLPIMEKFSISNSVFESLLSKLGTLNNEDIEALAKLFSNREDDYLRFSPIQFSKFVVRLRAIKLAPVLKTLIDDEEINNYERAQVLSNYIKLQSNDPSLEKSLNQYMNCDIQEISTLAINELIIRFRNNKAINKRFEQFKELARPVEESYTESVIYSRQISEWENEMDSTKLGQPLIQISEPSLSSEMINLLDFGLKKYKENKNFSKYCLYIIQIVYDFYESVRVKTSYSFLKELFYFLDSKYPNEKMLFDRYRSWLQASYISYFSKPKTINNCINRYNEIKSKAYLSIYNVNDLSFIIREIIDIDINNFIYHEGFYRVVDKYFINNSSQSRERNPIPEDYIQKTIKIQLENALLKKGIRDVDIIREPQLYNDKRIDLKVKYGFISPIIIELKLLHNDEIQNKTKRTEYIKKLNSYMYSQNAKFLIYLIFKVKKNNGRDEKNFHKMLKEYGNVDGLVIPNFIDCTM